MNEDLNTRRSPVDKGNTKGKASKKVVAHSPTKYEPYNDPAVLTAHTQAAGKAFTDMLRRSREAGGHDDDALQSDRPIYPFKQGLT
jgi:hypothetical protein